MRREQQDCSDQSDRREEEIHEEAPTPVDPLGERSAEQQSDGATTAGNGTEDTERLGTLTWIRECHGQQRQGCRGKERTEYALAGTSGNKHFEVDGCATDGGSDCEADQADDESSPAPEQVAQSTAE